MNKWKTYKLGEICDDVAMGPFGSNLKVDNFISEGVPVIRGMNLHEGGFNKKNFAFVSEEKANTLKRCLAYPDDLVFTHRGTLGQVGIIPKIGFEKYLVSQSQMRLSVNKKILNPKYLYYFFKSPLGQKELLKNVSQVGVPAIANPTKSLKEVEITIPDLAMQSEMASIISSLDDKIELNLQMNQTLETMAQAIFKDWFVNFNFPGFDGELVDGLPKDWRKGKLNEVARIEIGRTPPRLEEKWFSRNPKDIKWISIRDMGQSGIYIFNTLEFLTQEAIEKFKIPLIPANSVVLSFKLTIGRLAITTEPMLSNEAIAQINSSEFPAEYIYLYLKTYNWGSLGSTSSIATAVNSKIIKEMEILIPDRNISNLFFEVIKPIFDKLKSNSLEIETLTQIRDNLLPKLMTGKIEVRI